MKNPATSIRALACAAAMLTGCHMHEERLAEEPGAAPISYEYLYDCLWTVADFADGTDRLPGALADPDGALFFQNDGSTMYLLEKKSDTNAPDLPKDAYTVTAQGAYSVDTESNIITVTDGEKDCYFRIERLNDRTMTLYYRDERNEYIAYSRCLLSSITIVE
ncbi:MAG TPA: hypothetical protein H9866_00315 [Candidatus Tidjanibacter gallistercoris]|nr:hypothetical protein [Candidatus Tidjanibacter gallistercoris]